MADQQYRRHSSPGRANQGFSDASISLSSFGGSTPSSALEQTSDLLGLPGSTSMSYDLSSVPRALSTTNDYPSQEPNNTYNPRISFDGGSNPQPVASDTPALQWSHNYAIQSGSHNITAASSIAINRFQSEQQPSWTPLRAAPPPPPRSSSTLAPTQQKLGQRPGSNSRFPAGPGSDLVSRTNETDEGYYTHSQPDVQSIHSMGQWNTNQDPRHMQHGHVAEPLTYPRSGAGNRAPEQPDSNLHHDPINADPTVQSHDRANPLACTEEGCEMVSRTQSDFKKHLAWHKKEHVCNYPSCTRRTKGFTNINDLERHQKSVHGIQPKHGKSKDYKCFGDSCSKHEKVWPRLDNFKQHLKKMHRSENTDDLLHKSDEWYKQQQKPTDEPVVHAARQPSSSTSQQSRAQAMAQTGSHTLNQGLWNYSQTTEGGRASNMRPPTRITARNYAQSEVGHYSASVSESNYPQNMRRPLPGNTQLQPNRYFSIPCRIPQCSQSFATTKLLQEHMQVQHGLQNVSNPHGRGTQTGQRSHSIQGHQSSLISDQFGSGQRFPGHTTRVQSLDPQQMRAPNVRYSPRTAPGSIQALSYRIEEDFEPMPMTDSQDPLLASGSSDIILAQIGMTDAFLPTASHISNLDPHPSPGQDLNQPKDQPTKQAPQLSPEDVTSFLENFANSVSNNSAVSAAIATTVQSLQSISSSGEVNNPPTPAPALGEVDFPRVLRGENHVFLCPWEGCGKTRPRKCELKKHYQRHILPWACTFDGCRNSHKHFGSKNDWKRHEARQHEQQEKWRCGEQDANTSGKSVPATGDDACMRLFCTKELYLKHLKEQHHITDDDVTSKLCKLQRIGARCQGQYWCGFCNKIITMKSKGLEGGAERFNHIDFHFTKERRQIKDWVPLNGRPSPGESAPPSDGTSPEQSNEADSDEGDTDEDSPAEAQAAQTTRPLQRTNKRPASAMAGGDQSPASKVARSGGLRAPRAHKTRTHVMTCCNCPNTFELWQGTCTFCSHQQCGNCTAFAVESMEQE